MSNLTQTRLDEDLPSTGSVGKKSRSSISLEQIPHGLDPIDAKQRRAELMERLFGERSEPVKVGRFEILKVAGTGAMGRVYVANDSKLNRKVAIKRILSDTLDHESLKRHRTRLLREAQAAAQLSHPNVVEIYDVGVVDDDVYIAMEFVDGKTLRDASKEIGSDWCKQLRLFLQAGNGLAAAHQAGIVHRDFKPDNALVGLDHRVRVVDFGLAIPAKILDSTNESAAVTKDSKANTLNGQQLNTGGASLSIAAGGTPAYMPPEQIVGENIGPASDQFAFCVALYEALHGVRPFDEFNLSKRIGRVVNENLEAPAYNEDIPIEIRNAIRRGLKADPEDRFPTMHALLEQLRAPLQPKRSPWVYIGTAAAIAGALSALWWPTTSTLCEGAQASFDTAWTPDRRAAIRKTFDASESSYTAGTRDRVLTHLDHYRDKWVASYKDACEDTHKRQTQRPELLDLRMRCLSARKTEFAAIVDQLGQADESLMRRSVIVTTKLPSRIDQCNNTEALTAIAPLPTDPETIARIEHIQAQIAEAYAERVAGKHQQALSLADKWLAEVEALNYTPLTAELYHLRADLLHDLNRFREAAAADRTAFFAAQQSGDDHQTLNIAADLLILYGQEFTEEDDHAQWEQHALAAMERLGHNPRAQARLFEGLAALRKRENRLDEAIKLQQQALAFHEELGNPESGATAQALSALANMYNLVDRQEDALAAHRRVQAIFLKILGPDHPTYGATFINTGVALKEMAKIEEAAAEYRKGLAILKRAYGRPHLQIALALNNLANTLADLDQHLEAIRHWHQADRILQETGFDRHPHRATVIENLGTSLRQTGKAREAIDYETRAIAMKVATIGPEHPDLARALFNRALALLDVNRNEDALADLARAREIYRQTLGPKHSLYAITQGEIGWTLVRLGHHEEGIEEIEQSIEVRIAALGQDHPQVVAGIHALGAAYLDDGQPAKALTELNRALQIANTIQTSVDRDLDLKFDLARAMWDAGHDRKKARELAEQVLAGHRHRPFRQQSDTETIEAWLDAHPA